MAINSEPTMRPVRRVWVLLVLCGMVSTASAQAPEDARLWTVFQDAATGISFRYPQEWLLVSIPCRPGGDLFGCLSSVNLHPAPSPRYPVPVPALQVDVHTCRASNRGPGFPCTPEELRKSCEPFQVGDARAFECIDFDSETCHWSAVVPLDGREILIATPQLDEDARKDDRSKAECVERVIANRKTSPLKEIFASFSIPLAR